MPYDTVSTLAVERSSLVPDKGRTIVCRSCGDTMKHFRTISRFGVRPEQFMFRCPSCKAVDTKQVKRAA
jgi:protein-arginine kinase activator protein McsA